MNSNNQGSQNEIIFFVAVPFGAVTPFGGDFIIVSLKEVKNYLRIDFDDDDALIRQLMDTAQKLCMEIVRTDDISVLKSDKKSYKTAVLYSVAYLYENREKPDYNLMKLTLRALLANYRAEGF